MKIYKTVTDYLPDAQIGDIISIERRNFSLKNNKVPKLQKPHTNKVTAIENNKIILYRPFRNPITHRIYNMQTIIVLFSPDEYKQMTEYLNGKPKNTVTYKKLMTPQTYAEKCRTLEDIKKGIKDLNRAIRKLENMGMKTPKFITIRMEKLETKKKRLINLVKKNSL